jgi:F-type H+-transporting ATPase subunit c
MKIVKLACLVGFVFLATATPALAQAPGAPNFVKVGAADVVKGVPQTSVFSGAALGAGLGMAITIIGAGIGLGRIGSAAMEGMARQPEVAPRIQTAMIIIAAMLEGATLASVILCFLIGGSATF